jgi:hypothetical protein
LADPPKLIRNCERIKLHMIPATTFIADPDALLYDGPDNAQP